MSDCVLFYITRDKLKFKTLKMRPISLENFWASDVDKKLDLLSSNYCPNKLRVDLGTPWSDSGRSGQRQPSHFKGEGLVLQYPSPHTTQHY